MDKDEQDNEENNLNPAAFGMNLAVGAAVFTLLGYFADQKFKSEYFCTIIGIILGLCYCGYEFWKLIRQSKNESKK